MSPGLIAGIHPQVLNCLAPDVVVSICSRGFKCSGLASDKELTFHLLLGIQVTWSREHIDTGINASIIQSYAILFSALLSINRSHLSVCDVEYALFITSPPLVVYLVFASICDFFGVKTSLYKRIRYHRRITRALGVLILPLWFALNLTVWLSRQAFVGSDQGGGQPFRKWLFSTFMFFVLLTFSPGHNFYAVPVYYVCFFVCLFRSRAQFMADYRASRGGGRLRRVWMFVPCAWYVPVIARLTKSNVT